MGYIEQDTLDTGKNSIRGNLRESWEEGRNMVVKYRGAEDSDSREGEEKE